MDIFKSRRFWSAVVGIVVMVVVALVPELAQYQDTIIAALVAIFGILIGGYTAEDVARRLTRGYDKYAPPEFKP